MVRKDVYLKGSVYFATGGKSAAGAILL